MKKIALLSNINVDIIKQMLANAYEVFTPFGYNTMLQTILDSSSNLYSFQPDAVFILIDGYDATKTCHSLDDGKQELKSYLDVIKKLAMVMKNTPIIVAALDIPLKRIIPVKSSRNERAWEWYFYGEIVSYSQEFSNVLVFDLKELIENHGRDHFYSPKMWYLGSIPYSLQGSKLIVEQLKRYIKGLQGERKKCLCLDLDNTLWGGVIGEDGILNIELSDSKRGAIYYDLQKRIKEMKDTGILLTILSKNNIEEAYDVFENHHSMVLKEDDFSDIRVNWDEKSYNIQKMAIDMNIGLDSMAFLDDNPVEREKMKLNVPEVTTLDFPKEAYELENFMIEAYKDHFLSLYITKEDSERSKLYQEENVRKQLLNSVSSIDEYIKNLKISLRFHEIKDNEIERVSQLTQKTNQFNLTTKRYVNSDINKMMEDDLCDIFVVYACDKFGDSGLISVVIVKSINEFEAELDTFLMSCRVMGRNIEKAVLNTIETILYNKGITKIVAKYIATGKNQPVQNLYENNGYTISLVDENGSKTHEKYVCQHQKTDDEYINMIFE